MLRRKNAPNAAGGDSYEEYHPYGTTSWVAVGIATVSLKRYKYTAMERDEETGLQRHGVRYYATWLGRWTSADPIGLGDGGNRYCYCGGAPTQLSDTIGLGGTPPAPPPFALSEWSPLPSVDASALQWFNVVRSRSQRELVLGYAYRAGAPLKWSLAEWNAEAGLPSTVPEAVVSQLKTRGQVRDFQSGDERTPLRVEDASHSNRMGALGSVGMEFWSAPGSVATSPDGSGSVTLRARFNEEENFDLKTDDWLLGGGEGKPGGDIPDPAREVICAAVQASLAPEGRGYQVYSDWFDLRVAWDSNGTYTMSAVLPEGNSESVPYTEADVNFPALGPMFVGGVAGLLVGGPVAGVGGVGLGWVVDEGWDAYWGDFLSMRSEALAARTPVQWEAAWRDYQSGP